ncbi:MAG: hypothetical protein PWP31_2042, partial [Clostridia bacterium]|nr:hypothetical protein [Clostridia bacterium]
QITPVYVFFTITFYSLICMLGRGFVPLPFIFANKNYTLSIPFYTHGVKFRYFFVNQPLTRFLSLDFGVKTFFYLSKLSAANYFHHRNLLV